MAGTAVAGVIWALKYFAGALSEDIREHTKSTIELKTYLVERNGRDNEMHKERMEADTRQIQQEQEFQTEMVVHLKDLKKSDVALAKAVKQVQENIQS